MKFFNEILLSFKKIIISISNKNISYAFINTYRITWSITYTINSTNIYFNSCSSCFTSCNKWSVWKGHVCRIGWLFVEVKNLFVFCLELIFFNSILFDGISRIYPNVFVFGFVYLCQLVRSFIIVFIFGRINVFLWFQSVLHRRQKQKNLKINQLLYVRRSFLQIGFIDFHFLVIFDWTCLAAYCCYTGLFFYIPVHYILAENYPIVTRIIILAEQVTKKSRRMLSNIIL